MNVNEIKEKTFETGMRGYRQEEVNNYLVEVCGYVKELQSEKADLLKKMEVLALKVEEYRKDEESIREALLGAQKLGKSVLAEAKEKADALAKESEAESQKMLNEAKTESERMLGEAKTVAQDLLIKTKTESERMNAEAKQNVENILRTTKYQIEKEQANLVRTQKEVSAFKSQLLEVYRNHIDLIKKLPEQEIDAEQEQEKEVRDLNKKIYEQKSEEKKSVDHVKEVVVNTQTIKATDKKADSIVPTAVPRVPGEPVVIPTADDPVAPPQTPEPVTEPAAPAEPSLADYPGLAAVKIQETKEYDKTEIKTVNEHYRAKTPPKAAEKAVEHSAARPVEKSSLENPVKKPAAEHHKTSREHYVEKFGELQFGGKTNK